MTPFSYMNYIKITKIPHFSGVIFDFPFATVK